jgi:PAS domain S-box-containing protein
VSAVPNPTAQEPWHVRALQALPAGVAWLEADHYVWANDAFCELVGRSPEALVGQHGYCVLAPHEVERVRARHQARKRGEPVPGTYEMDVVRPDGKQVRLELTPRVLPGGETLLLFRPLGERVRDLALLGALWQLAATVQKASSVAACARTAAEGMWALGLSAGIFRLEQDSAIHAAVAMRDDVREVLERISGAPLEQLRLPIGQLPPFSRTDTENRPLFLDDAQSALRNLARLHGRPWTPELEQAARAAGIEQLVHVPLNVGGERWGVLSVIGTTLQSNDAAALGLFGAQLGSAIEAAETIQNLEQHNHRLQVVQQLAVHGVQGGLQKLAAQLLRELAEGTRSDTAALYLVNRPRGVLALVEAVGLTAEVRETYQEIPLDEPLVGGPNPLRSAHRVPLDPVAPEVRERLEANLIREVAVVPLWVDGVFTGVVYLTRRDRDPYATSELREAETLVALVALQVERARLFEHLRDSYEQLSRAQEELVKNERLAALGELSALVAHEVRNPLGAIVNSVAALRRLVPEQGDGKLLLGIVAEESDRLNRMVSDLLDFARPAQPQLRELPVEVLVLGAVESAVRGGSGPSGVQVKTELCPAAPTVRVDPQMFRQALVNLVTNAVQASPEGGTVVVRAHRGTLRDEDCVAVEVSDEGAGVPPELAERIFQPFFTTRASGTGLGLAVVKRIAEIHRAEISLLPGSSGATFRLLLPL